MKTFNHVTKLLALSVAGLVCTANAATINTTVNTTVVNSFGLANTTALNFGDLRAARGTTAVAGDAAVLKIFADPSLQPAPTAGANGAVLSSLGGVQRGVFDITGAAPFAELTINFPTTATTLSADPAIVGPGAPTLVIPAQTVANEWTAWILTGPRAASAYDATTRKLQTTTGGAVSFQIGATLRTVETGTALVYPDAPYTGNYNLEVVY